MKFLFWCFMLLITLVISPHAVQAQACGTNEPTGFSPPFTPWRLVCEFDTMCRDAHHMGVDINPILPNNSRDVAGTPVTAPCTGVVKESRFSRGYGGEVLLECWTGSQCISTLLGHMDSRTLQVRVNQTVIRGRTVLGYIGEQSAAINGDTPPHIHLMIRKGRYSSFNYSGCSYKGGSVWSYGGYPGTCYQKMLPDLLDPLPFISANVAPPPAPGTAAPGVPVYYPDAQLASVPGSQAPAPPTQAPAPVTAAPPPPPPPPTAAPAPATQAPPPPAPVIAAPAQVAPPAPGQGFTFNNDGGNNPYTCSYQPSSLGAPDWVYSCTKQTLFNRGTPVWMLIRIDEVFRDPQFKVEAYRNGVQEWLWIGDPVVVDHQYGWRHVYAWPNMQNVALGHWELRYYVNTGNGFPAAPLATSQFDMVDLVTPPYRYDGNMATCAGPVTGGANTNWAYTCNNPKRTFNRGETAYAMVRLDRIWTDFSWHVEVYRNGQFQWNYDTAVNDVDEQWGWGFAYFTYFVPNPEPGNWEVRMFARPNIQDPFPTASVTFTVNP